jgi:hypothetical protein
MNMISTGTFQTEMDASNKQSTLAEKFAAVWEKKNAKAARAGGVSLMALSLAACGSDDDTATTTTTTVDTVDTTTVDTVDTTTTTVVTVDTTVVNGVFTTSLSDALTGNAGDDTFTGVQNGLTTETASGSDTVDGGAGSDTVNITNTTANAYSGLTLSNVENFVYKATNGGDLDADDISGITSLELKSTVGAMDLSDLLTSMELTFTNSNSDMNTSATFKASGVTGATDAAIVNVDGVEDGADLALVGNVETVTINANNNNSRFNDLELAAGTTTVNINANVDLRVDTLLTAAGVTSIDVGGAGAVRLDATTSTLSALSTYNASDATGGQNVAAVAANNLTFTGGTGDDTLNVGGSITADDSFEGGAGADTFRVDDEDQLGAALMGTVNDFETLQIDIVDAAATLDVDNIEDATSFVIGDGTSQTDRMQANLTIDDAVTGSSVTLDAVNDADDTLTFDLKSDGAADVLDLTLRVSETGATGAMGAASFVADDIETLNLATSKTTAATLSGNSVSLATFTMTDLTTLNIAGAVDLALGATATTGNTALTAIDANGATGDIDLGDDGTAFVTAATGATVTMGSGNDMVHLDVGTSGLLKTVDLGSSDAITVVDRTDGDTLSLDSASGVGLTIVDLTSTTDQISQLLGSANAAAQTGIEHIDLSDFAQANATTSITGTADGNQIFGGAGVDTVSAGAGADTITTIGGADVIDGGAGADTITGGAGADDITTGAGADTVILASTNDGLDTIQDFTAGASGDVLHLSLAALQEDAAGNNDGDLINIDIAASSVAAGDAVVISKITGATNMDAITTDTLILHVDLAANIANAAALDSALEKSGGAVLTMDGTDVAKDMFLALYDNGTDSFLAHVEIIIAATNNASHSAGELVATNLVRFVGVADANSLVAGNFDLIA